MKFLCVRYEIVYWNEVKKKQVTLDWIICQDPDGEGRCAGGHEGEHSGITTVPDNCFITTAIVKLVGYSKLSELEDRTKTTSMKHCLKRVRR